MQMKLNENVSKFTSAGNSVLSQAPALKEFATECDDKWSIAELSFGNLGQPSLASIMLRGLAIGAGFASHGRAIWPQCLSTRVYVHVDIVQN